MTRPVAMTGSGYWLIGRSKHFFHAAKSLNINVKQGATLGVVGESGSGKTTLALAIMRLIRSEGRIVFQGSEIDRFSQRQMRPLRSDMQIVFQDPYGSLSPRMTNNS